MMDNKDRIYCKLLPTSLATHINGVSKITFLFVCKGFSRNDYLIR